MNRFWRFINFLDSKIYFTGNIISLIMVLLPLEPGDETKSKGGIVVRGISTSTASQPRGIPLLRGIKTPFRFVTGRKKEFPPSLLSQLLPLQGGGKVK